jgi:DNA polymerase-3 subunit alpha
MQTGWLGTYYPLEFYSALLTWGQANDLQEYVSDIKRAGIKVMPVDINESKLDHVVQEKSIRLSFRSIKGVGPSAIQKIMSGQPYDDFFDFVLRSKAHKAAIEPLIFGGAFDKMHKNMRQVMEWYELFQQDGKYRSKKWDEYRAKCREIQPEDYELHHKVALENELLGFSVRGSPFEILGRKAKIEEVFGSATITYNDFVASTEEVGMIPVVIKDFKERAQRNGKMMAFVKFGTELGEEFEAPAFANIWQWMAPKARRGSVYITTFNKKVDEPENLVIGRPGWAQSAHSVAQAFINVDEIEVGQ